MTFPSLTSVPEQVLPGSDLLWRFQDCCNVYILRRRERALLVDLGSGAVLDHLPALGIHQVDAVLFTHAHRDQCAGAPRALAAGIPLRFPASAREFVDPSLRPDLHGPSPLVRAYPGRFEPPRPFPCNGAVAFDLRPGQRLRWEDLEVEFEAAAGHINHQLAFLVDAAGHRLCFCGDAMHSPGRIHEAYHWETDHYTGAGLRAGIETLRVLRHHRPDLLLPSHGPGASGPLWDVFLETEASLRALAEVKDTIVPRRPAVRRLVPPRSGVLMEALPGLWVWNNSYFLVSAAGPVLMVDNAGPLPGEFWEQYRRALGERPITTILVTHIHCDHVEGILDLRRRGWQGEVWAHEHLVPCIEDPHRYRRPWLPERGVKVDRALAEGQEFSFHEHALAARFAPGQTDLHACYPLTLAGIRIILSGDNFYPAQQWGGTGGLCGLNGGHPELWRRTIQLYLEYEPEWVLASHIHPFEYRREDFLTMLAWCDEAAAAMRAVAPDGNLERHHVPHTFNLVPYARRAVAGVPFTVRACFHNPWRHAVEVSALLRVPAGWSAAPTTWSGALLPGSVGGPAWEVSALATQGERAELVTADLYVDGHYLGEKAECYVRVADG
jgi:glyoxylase-like metal-dependent hydrolase (beta-lactamase superfamily II)